MNEALAGYRGKEVTFGLRPEHFGSTVTNDAKDAGSIRAVVDVVEPLGAESHIYLKAGPSFITCLVDGHTKFDVNSEIDVAVLTEKCHFYDIETGSRID